MAKPQYPKLKEIPTPALILDLNILRANLRRMSERMNSLGVSLRPHQKTAKCSDIAEMSIEGHSGGITVSTLAEAGYFGSRGFKDQTYAIPIVPDKLDLVAQLQESRRKIGITTDELEIAREIGRRAAETNTEFQVWIEVDSGYHRSGVTPEADELLAIGRVLQDSRKVVFRGILTHAGQSYGAPSVEEVRRVAETERSAMVRAAGRLRAAGIPCPVVSVGSTPTAVAADNLDGIDEARPGNYMFFDLFMAGLGVCGLEDIAISVLTTVISQSTRHGHALVDAGALALSKDLSAETKSYPGVGYGLACEAHTRKPLLFKVENVCQEQGWLTSNDPNNLPGSLPVGTRLSILPNHSCLTGAGHSFYWVTEGEEVVGIWERTAGWAPFSGIS